MPADGFTWTHRPGGARAPVFARRIVASSQALASSAGLLVLARGGNAVDAAVASAAVMAVTEPCSNGLGSDLFAQVWDGARLHGLNASGWAPARWTPEYFRNRHGGALPERGWDTVTVPGAVAGWSALQARFGRLAWADVFEPALRVAREGFAVAPITREKWRRGAALLAGQPGFAEHFLPRGRAPEVGENVVIPGLERALGVIARDGAQAFYRGEIAQAIAAFARAGGGALAQDDLADFEPEWVEPLSIGFSGHELHELPPNGQGLVALMALGILRHAGIGACAADSVDWHHLQIEAVKLAFADACAHLSDPRAMRLAAADLLDEAYLARRARAIDPRRAATPASGQAPRGGTIYLCTADAEGMMVSLIQSNYLGFGSGIVVPGWGISLQNRGLGFTLEDGHPNQVAPRKRPFHTIIPGFLTQAGSPRMAFGVMGGTMQPQGQVQTLCRMLLAREQPQAACDAPRWKWNRGLEIEVEDSLPGPLREGLEARGHRIVRGDDSYMDFGSGQFIWRQAGETASYVAASDNRRDGQACGF